MLDAAIEVNQLAKTYRRRFRPPVDALKGVSFAVRPGEVFGLLGPNGAGKTTVLKCLLGIARPSGGSATVLGEPITQVGYRRRIGYLPEGHQFPAYLTAAQILDFVGAMRGTPRTERRARIGPLLELVGMTAHADKKVREFSKGMKQRTGLAAALVNEPDVLFLDEPTDGVDPVGRRDIRVMIGDLCRKRGLTVILNSHMLGEVEMIANRVAIMNLGELKQIGTVEDVVRAGEQVAKQYRIMVPTGALQNLPQQELDLFGHGLKATADRLEVRFDTPEDLNALIDYLRGRGVLILGVQPARATLEDVFMELIGAPMKVDGGDPGATRHPGEEIR